MQKSQYYPSPLRKDYNITPMKNLLPKSQMERNPYKNQQVKIKSERSTLNKSYHTTSSSSNNNPKVSKYIDGTLIEIYQVQDEGYGIFLGAMFDIVIFDIKAGMPSGKIYFLHPQGLVVSARLSSSGFIEGQMVGFSKNRFFHSHHYKKGIRQGEQHYFDLQENLLVTSKVQRNNLKEINKGIKGNIRQLLLDQKGELSSIYSSLESKELILNTPQSFLTVQILGKKFKYFGEIMSENQESSSNNSSNEVIPHGYGVMMSENQMFAGNFVSGVLMGVGCIQFSNNTFYHGDIMNGLAVGYGSIRKGKNISYRFNQQKIEKQEFLEFLKISQKPQIHRKWFQIFPRKFMLEEIKLFYDEMVLRETLFFHKSTNNQKSLEDQEEPESSHLNIELYEQSESERKQFTPKIGTNSSFEIPKLSLIKEESKRNAETDRHEPGIQNKFFKRERNFQQQQGRKTVNVVQVDKPQKRTKRNETFSEREQFLGVEELGKDKWYVTNEFSGLSPKEMATKRMFKKQGQQNYEVMEKNKNPSKINYTKLRKASSTISEGVQNDFISKNFQF